MKRIFLFFICAFMILSLASCGESVNMTALTEYQSKSFEAELKISACGKEYRGIAKKSEGRLFLTLSEPRELSPFTFVFDKNGSAVIAGEAEIPFCAENILPFSEIYPFFSVPIAGTWKIEKKKPGGVSLYVCECEGLTLYIDSGSFLPLKIMREETVADIISFTVN